MKPVTIHAAKTNLSKLIERVCAGEEIVIARGMTPVAKLVPIAPKRKPVFGAFKDRASFDDTFFDPLPEALLKAWNK